ncbi:hypothetical protein KUD11_10215 [Roseovarius sp. LXJ103]|nr:hypothetical protein [Roseovarius carneus]MBZ8119020.1 hypothetical protein [Roseovarius carneus]
MPQSRSSAAAATAARMLSRLARPRKPQTQSAHPPDLDTLARRIILPFMPITDEEMARAAHQDRGQKLARQEMWEELAQQLRAADLTRTATPGGESGAMLLAFGARSDVVAVAEDTLYDGKAPAPDGIDALEAVGREFPDKYPIALIIALAHIDLAWAWENTPGDVDNHLSGRQAHFDQHITRAEALLAPYCGLTENAPSLAAAQCALLAARPGHGRCVADAYEDLIDLDPSSPRHMRALGQAIVPARGGSLQALELEARRTAARSGDIWGAGAYSWVYLDAVAMDPEALIFLDVPFFIDGLRDILRVSPDQHTANQLAAFCAITMRPRDGAPRAEIAAREALSGALVWILQEHLHELHPLIWTQALRRPGAAAPLPSRRALITEGRQTALRAIAALFADDIKDGSAIAFSPAGMYRLPTL